jgi:hypothetical protein
MARKNLTNLLPMVALVVGGLALVLTLGLTGCGPSVEVAAEGYGEAQLLVDQAQADLAARLNVAVEAIVVESVEAAEFPDASLGVPEPGVTYAQVVTPGYVIVLAVDGAAYEYHADGERVVRVPAVGAGPSDPAAVVDGFYRWYVDYPGSPLADGAYRASEHLAPEFVAQVDALIASFDKEGYDPFLCAQDVPGDLVVRKASVAGEAASVVLQQTWNPGTEYAFTREVTVSLELVDGDWKIAGVVCEAPEPASAPLPEGPLPTTPEGAVQGFYSWYLWYARNMGHPLADGAYRTSEYLTWPLIEKVDALIASFDKGGYDPFLCAQDIPESFSIDAVEIAGDTARVVVSTSFEGHALTLSLFRMGERWAIDDVACFAGGGAPLGDQVPVAGWLGCVVSTPAGAQFDDYVALMPEGAGEVGIEGADEAIRARIVALRDKAEPGKYAHFWGTLTCDVIDYGGCQLLVTRVRVGTEVAEPEPVEGWEGTIVGNPPGSQFDDYFVLAGDFPVGYGIGSIGPETREQLAALRDTGARVRVWGLLRTGVPDAFGAQIDVTRVETTGDPDVAVDGWLGTVVNLPPGNQFGQYFCRDDGERFGIAAESDAVRARVREAAWTGAQIQVWGTLYTGVPAAEARQIVADRIEIVGGPATEPRNLSSFAALEASSVLPADRGGTYVAWAAVDGLPESAWVEGVPGPGVGESITLTFPEPVVVERLGVDVGFDRDADIFAKNNRLERATATFSNGESVALAFSDSRGVQVIDVEPVETSFVRLVIEAVYPGTKYDDTCLAEVEVWGVVKR